MSRSRVRNDRKVRSSELSARAWAIALKKSSECMKRTVYPERTAVKPRAWARKLFPTPAGPSSRTCSCLVRNSMEKTASSRSRAKVMDADESQSSPDGGFSAF